MGRYNRTYYKKYYNDYDYENPIAGIVTLVFLYLLYKIFTNWNAFLRLTFYALIVTALLLILVLVYRFHKKKKYYEISKAASLLNNDIRNKFIKENIEYLKGVDLLESDKRNSDAEISEEKFSVWQEALYRALINRGIKCYKEKWDQYKHIDIAIPWARLNIEVDGMQHYFNERQMNADIDRTFYSAKQGYKTIAVPNIMIEKNLDSIANNIANIARRQYFRRKNNY